MPRSRSRGKDTKNQPNNQALSDQQHIEPSPGTPINYKQAKAGTRQAQEIATEMAHAGDDARLEALAALLDKRQPPSWQLMQQVREWLMGGAALETLRNQYREYTAAKDPQNPRSLRSDITKVFGQANYLEGTGSFASLYLLDVYEHGKPTAFGHIILSMGLPFGSGCDEIKTLEHLEGAKDSHRSWIFRQMQVHFKQCFSRLGYARAEASARSSEASLTVVDAQETEAQAQRLQGQGADTLKDVARSQTEAARGAELQAKQEHVWEIVRYHLLNKKGILGGTVSLGEALDAKRLIEKAFGDSKLSELLTDWAKGQSLETRRDVTRPGSWLHKTMSEEKVFQKKSARDKVMQAILFTQHLPDSFFTDAFEDAKDKIEKKNPDKQDATDEQRQGTEAKREEKFAGARDDVSREVLEVKKVIGKLIAAHANTTIKKGIVAKIKHKTDKDLAKKLKKVFLKLSREQFQALMFSYLDPNDQLLALSDPGRRDYFGDKGVAQFIALFDPFEDPDGKPGKKSYTDDFKKLKFDPQAFVDAFTRVEATDGMIDTENGYLALKKLLKDKATEVEIIKALSRLAPGEYAWVRNDAELMKALPSAITSDAQRERAGILLGIDGWRFGQVKADEQANYTQRKKTRGRLKGKKLNEKREEDHKQAKDTARETFANAAAIKVTDKEAEDAKFSDHAHEELSTRIHEAARAQIEHNPRYWSTQLEVLFELRNPNSVKVYTLIDRAYYAGKAASEAIGEEGFTTSYWAGLVDAQLSSKLRGEILATPKYAKAWQDFIEGKVVSTDTRLAQAELIGIKQGAGNKMRAGDVAAAFEDLQGTELLEEWSDIEMFRQSKREHDELAARLEGLERINQQATDGGAEAPHQLGGARKTLGALRSQLRHYTPRIRDDRHALIEESFNTSKRSELVGSLNDKLIQALEADPDYREAVIKSGAAIDDYALEDAKLVNTLANSHRMADTGVKWRGVSSRHEQMGEARAIAFGTSRSVHKGVDFKGEQASYDESREGANKQAGDLEGARKDLGESTERFTDVKALADKIAMTVLKGVLKGLALAAKFVAGALAGPAGPLAVAITQAITVGVTGIINAIISNVAKSVIKGDAYEATEMRGAIIEGVISSIVTGALTFAAALPELTGLVPTESLTSGPVETDFFLGKGSGMTMGWTEHLISGAMKPAKGFVKSTVKTLMDEITTEERARPQAIAGDHLFNLLDGVIKFALGPGLGGGLGAADQGFEAAKSEEAQLDLMQLGTKQGREETGEAIGFGAYQKTSGLLRKAPKAYKKFGSGALHGAIQEWTNPDALDSQQGGPDLTPFLNAAERMLATARTPDEVEQIASDLKALLGEENALGLQRLDALCEGARTRIDQQPLALAV